MTVSKMYFIYLVSHKKKFRSALYKEYGENQNNEETQDTELRIILQKL